MVDTLITAPLKAILSQISTSIFKDTAKKVGATLSTINAGFERYYDAALTNYAYTKTIVDPDNRCVLKELYVEQAFKDSDNNSYDEFYLIEKLRAGEKLILKGHGGTGKTFFVKNTFFDLCENPMGVFPIFLELRSMNKSNKGIKRHLYELLFEKDAKLFDSLAKQGKFLFILDGYDEIDYDKRSQIADKILKLAYTYPDCGMLVTSRYADDLTGWNNFLSYSVKDFNREQTLELLSKVEYNEDIKQNLVQRIDQAFFDKHKPFLSSPLLALMMLITFGTTDQLPNKFSEYYDLSFRAMFYRHDSLKHYTRKRALQFSDFQLFFSYFCMLSYCAKDILISFDEKQLSQHIRKSIKLANLDASEEDLYREITEATCLIQKEGLKYLFIHRSYQEYFCALGIINNITDETKKTKLYDIVFHRGDSILPLAHEINNQDVEAYYILPTYTKMKSKFSNIKRIDLVEVFVYGRSMVKGKNKTATSKILFNSATITNSNFLKFANFIHNTYVDLNATHSRSYGFSGAFDFINLTQVPLFGNMDDSVGLHLDKNYSRLMQDYLDSPKKNDNAEHDRLKAMIRGNGQVRLIFPQYTSAFARDESLTKLLNTDTEKWSLSILKKIENVKREIKSIQKRHVHSNNSFDNLLD